MPCGRLAPGGVKQTSNSSLIDHYTALKITESDFYPFGMQMQERTSSTFTANYRYGFNGKEQDDEVKGIGNQIDYGARVYDPRLGRFLSMDPLAIEYPWNSPYSYAENDPISNIDLDGLEKVKSISYTKLIGQGLKNGYNEFTGGIKHTSKSIMSSQTYRQGWQKVKEFGNLAMKDPNKAVQVFNKGTNNLAIGISNALTQPVIWTMNIPNRSKEENLVGLGYGMWKAGEFYVMFEASELLEGGEGIPAKSNLKIDLMGGRTSSLGKGFVNYDLLATKGIKDDVVNFGKYFGKNTITEIVVNNPQGDFLKYVTDALDKDGTITVRGNLSNKYFKSIYNGTAKGMENFEITEMKNNVPNLGYKKTSGEDIQGEIHEVLLKKKSNN